MQFIFRRLVALCGDFRATLNGDPFGKRCKRYGALAGRYGRKPCEQGAVLTYFCANCGCPATTAAEPVIVHMTRNALFCPAVSMSIPRPHAEAVFRGAGKLGGSRQRR